TQMIGDGRARSWTSVSGLLWVVAFFEEARQAVVQFFVGGGGPGEIGRGFETALAGERGDRDRTGGERAQRRSLHLQFKSIDLAEIGGVERAADDHGRAV